MIHSLVMRGLLFALLWWMLAEGRHDGWLPGAVAVFTATWTSIKLLPPGDRPIRIAGLFGFLHFFLSNSIRGGIQVAGMALRGRSALQPVLLELTVTLPPGGPSILLVNVLGLMPGTVGVEMRDARLHLHVLDERLPVVAEVRALEAVIGRLFGIPA
ncbi:MAG: Na+/H+ antiporter subunit E [Sulfuritalea sp.]|nr:Na+/H+ antiporter subunit E [Sulfuritalea sp.]MDP1983768.1 Na+/H+ antiporter subunit E [Sulfuritalea sp.]